MTEFNVTKKNHQKRNAIIKIVLIAVFVVLFLLSGLMATYASTWEFDQPEQGKVPGKNPFTPRGYLIDTGKGQQWLSSKYGNTGEVIKYTGEQNGVDWIEAKDSYKLYAMTDRNPTPGKTHLIAWKNGRAISGFGNLAGTPGRGDAVDPSGNGTCWVIPLEGFQFEPGCFYEFGFYQGMQANNGITLVFSEDGKGYIQAEKNDDGTYSWEREEKKRYDKFEYEEYQYPNNLIKTVDENGEKHYTYNQVPMRFSVQTYADMTTWNTAAKKVQDFLDGVTESDYASGSYVRANVENLQATLKEYQSQADSTVKKQLQTLSEVNQKKMADDILSRLQKTMTERAQESDLSELTKTIQEAEQLYDQTKDNTGKKVGQYSKLEVQALEDEIAKAKKIHKYDTQEKINQEVTALKDQILSVKASKVKGANWQFYDKATGITVIAPITAFATKPSMEVRRLDTKSNIYKSMSDNLTKSETKKILYDIAFFNAQHNRTEPKTKVQIQIPIPSEMKGMTVSVIKVDDEGEIKTIQAAQSNGVKVFKYATVDMFALTAHKMTKAEKKAADTQAKQNATQQGSSTENSNGNTPSDQTSDSNSSEQMLSIMQQITKNLKEKKDNNEERELIKKQKNKEELKPPEAVAVKHNKGNSFVGNRVTRYADPKYMVYSAIALACLAILMGVKAIHPLQNLRRRRRRIIK